MTVISADLDCKSPYLSTSTVMEAIGLIWRCVIARAMCLRGMWRHVRLSSATDLPRIIRSIPCKPDSEIGFLYVVAMKAWKRQTSIFKTKR
jgi:hypothetical protein